MLGNCNIILSDYDTIIINDNDSVDNELIERMLIK